jgi:hypothetical protein
VRSIVKKIGKLTFLLIVVACTAEIVLRVAWPQIFPIYERGMLSPDPVLGHVLTPNFNGTLSRVDFNIDVRINRNGLRGPELQPRGGSTVRILFLGDSMTWGWGVTDEQIYPAVLGQQLRARYRSVDIQIINAGVPFYGTIDEVAFLRHRIGEFDPDIVVVTFNAVDDFEQNRRPSINRQVFEDGILRYVPDYEWARGPAWTTLLNRAKHYSHLLRLESETAGRVLMRADMLSSIDSVSSNFFNEEEAETARRLLTEIALLSEQQGAPVVFVYAPEKMQALAKPTEELRAARLVRETAESVNAAFVDLTPPAAAHSDVEMLFSRAEGWWTVSGHQMIASQLFDEIVNEQLINNSR